jgi:hypothetical protein
LIKLEIFIKRKLRQAFSSFILRGTLLN